MNKVKVTYADGRVEYKTQSSFAKRKRRKRWGDRRFIQRTAKDGTQ